MMRLRTQQNNLQNIGNKTGPTEQTESNATNPTRTHRNNKTKTPFKTLLRNICQGLLLILTLTAVYQLNLLVYTNFTVTISPSLKIGKTINNNTNYPTLLIGLGGAKCGTSTMMTKIKLIVNSLPNYIIFNHREARYWTKCYGSIVKIAYWKYVHNMGTCNMDEYLREIFYIPQNINSTKQLQMKNYMLIEKSAQYFTQYMAAHALAFYAKQPQFNLYFYVLVRNPIKRLWSNHWMKFMRQRHLQRWKNEIHDVHIATAISNIKKLVQSIPYKYPTFDSILKLLKSGNNLSNTTNGSNIYEKEIADLMEYVQINEMSSNEGNHPNIVKSCYYPTLLTWKYAFNAYDESGALFEKRFKIIETEYFVKNQKDTITDLLCWAQDYDRRKCEALYAVKENKRINSKIKYYSFAPPNIDVMNLSVTHDVLYPFFFNCNERLYDFLKRNPKLLLPNHHLFTFN